MLLVLAGGCKVQNTDGVERSASEAGPTCAFDTAESIDCAQACEHYSPAYERARRNGVQGELMTPEACPDVCRQMNDADPLNRPGPTVIRWNCWVDHEPCSDASRHCQQACLASADLDATMHEAAICLPPEMSSGA